MPAAHRRKRPLERGKYEQLDRVMDKMYKRNYWEDPAYAWRLRHFGLDLARDAAYENLFERAAREHEQPPPPPMILFCRLVGLRPRLIRKKKLDFGT